MISFSHDFYDTEEEYTSMRQHLIKTLPEDFTEESYSPERTITRVIVECKISNKEKVFEIMAETIKNISKSQLDEGHIVGNQSPHALMDI